MLQISSLRFMVNRKIPMRQSVMGYEGTTVIVSFMSTCLDGAFISFKRRHEH